jgi:hypothetical protein
MSRFSLELKSCSIRSSSMRMFFVSIVGQELSAERRPTPDVSDHFRFVDDDDRAVSERGSRCHPVWLSGEAASPKKCQRSSTAMTASLPACDSTESRTVP